MKSDIKKIVLKQIKDDLYTVIVIMQSGVVKRYEDVSKEEAETRIINNIKKLENQDFSGLSGKEIIEKLISDGFLKFVDNLGNDLNIDELFKEKDSETYDDLDDQEIKKIIYYSEDNLFEVYLENGNVHSFDFNEDLYENWVKFACEQYGCSDARDLQDKGILIIKKKKKQPSKLVETIKKSKIKNLITKKRLISLAVATALVATGFGISELKNKKSGSSKNDGKGAFSTTTSPNPNPSPTSEMTALSTEIPTPDPNPSPTSEMTALSTEIPTPDPTVVPIKTPEVLLIENAVQPDIEFSTPEFILEGNQLVVEIGEEHHTIRNYGEENYESYDVIDLHSLENMGDLANHIQNPKGKPDLTTTGRLIYYEKFFDDEIDNALISHFSKYRNAIIWEAFAKNNIDMARYYINEANKEAVRVIYDNNPIQVVINNELKYIYYEDLTPNAKQGLLNIAWSMFDPFINDNFEYEGEIYDQTKVAERVFGIKEEKTK